MLVCVGHGNEKGRIFLLLVVRVLQGMGKGRNLYDVEL